MRYIELVRRSQDEWIVIVIDPLPLGECCTYSFDSVEAAERYKSVLEVVSLFGDPDVDWGEYEI